MLKPYDAYKPFNLPWLTTIPSHWDELRNKNVMTDCKKVVGKDSNQYTLLSLTLNGIIARDMENAKGKFPKEFDTYKIVEKDDIVFCLFDIDETPRTVGISPLNGMLTGAYDVFKINGINKRFLYYYYLSLDNVKAMKPLYTGLRKVINVPVFMGTKLPVPSSDEQDQIVRYLDIKLAKINMLIKAQKKQIALLKEQKQAVINQAVTKGLDPNAKMKPSGIEWVGVIPENWEIKRCSSCFTENKNLNTDFHVQQAFSFKFGNIVNKTEFVIDEELKETYSKYTIVNINDIVVNGLNLNYDFVTQRVGLVQERGIITSAYMVITSRNTISPGFACFLLKSMDAQKMLNGMGTGIRLTLAFPEFKKFCIAVPPIEEQNEIVKYCENLTAVHTKLILSIEKQLTFFSEYRTRLVSDVISGKVDVQDVHVEEDLLVESTLEEDFEETDMNDDVELEE